MKKLLKNKWFKRIALSITSVAIIVAVAVPLVQASQPRDFDSNAIVWGGFYSVNELNNKLNHGTGKPYQSSSQLKHLYTTLGINQSDFGRLSNGAVYKDGRVVVNGKTVFRNAHSSGRQWMPGSTKDNRFSYPVYWRPTSVSFVSTKIDAFVLMNHDGTMAWALIKSCGNAVRGVGVKTPPEERQKLEIKKFNDRNGDGVRQGNEPWLANWSFKVVGPNINKTVKTAKDGSITVKNLKKGNYTVTELQKANWTSTTGLKKKITIKKNDVKVIFGNKRIVTPTFEITAKKFEDVNGNGIKEEDEAWIEGWSIRLSGNSTTQELLTNSEGAVDFSGLSAGTYQVSEETRTGWQNMTPIVVAVTVNSDLGDGYAEFGNQKVPENIVTTTTIQNVENLPVSGPVEAIAGTLATIGIGGAAYMYRKSHIKLKTAFQKF